MLSETLLILKSFWFIKSIILSFLLIEILVDLCKFLSGLGDSSKDEHSHGLPDELND